MEDYSEIRQLIAAVVESRGAAARSCYDRYKAILTKYQEQPQLLDGCLESIVQPLALLLRQAAISSTSQDTNRLQDVCRLLHVLVTVRGYKTVVRFFPHEAADLERVLQVLEFVRDSPATTDNSSNDNSIALWEAQAVLMLWLSILVLIPFDLSILDSAVTDEQDAAAVAQTGYTPLAAKIMQLCQQYLQHPGAVREMAALLLARLLTRPDMSVALQDFITWQQQAVSGATAPAAVFLLPGILQTLALIFKIGRRQQLLPLAPGIWQQLAQLLDDDSSSSALSSNMLARKVAVKLAQRIGLNLLPPQLTGWRCSTSTATDLGKNLGAATPAVASLTAVPAQDSSSNPTAATEAAQPSETEYEVREEIEDVLGAVLSCCSDKDTVVRWSAAKGVGRLGACLPQELAEEVVDGALALLSPSEPDTSWHGGCLAIAELARRGILSPARLDSVSGLLQQALAYDVRRGPHSVGAHVRDAAAYVCWALARAYRTEQLSGCVNALAASLLVVACYDREVNCRRAAASAFQECVGRLGSFPHGLEILAVADYYSVGNISSAYLRVAPFIASFPEYTEAFLDHLVTVKLRHWDKALRSLAAMGLAALAPVAARRLADAAIPKLLGLITSDVLEVRTGVVLGLAEILPALPAAGLQSLNPTTADSIAAVLSQLEAAGMYRGKGGELMREAAARLIEQTAAAVAGLTVVPSLNFAPTKRHQAEQDMFEAEQQQQQNGRPMRPSSAATDGSDPDEDLDTAGDSYDNVVTTAPQQQQQQQRLQLALPLTDTYHQPANRLILDCLSHVQNSIQASGVAALAAHTRAFQAVPDLQQRLLLLVNECSSRLRGSQVLAAARKGAAAALGVLPRELIRSQAGEIVKLLAATAQAPLDPGSGFNIETRIAAINSLAQITIELLGTTAPAAAPAAAAAIAPSVLSTCVCPSLLAALDDYTRDNRGDVGSWVREAAMDGLVRIVLELGGLQQQQRHALQRALSADPLAIIAQGVQSLQICTDHQEGVQSEAAAGLGALWSAAAVHHLHCCLSLLVTNGLLRQALERIARLRESAVLHVRSLLQQPAAAAVVLGAADIAAVLPDNAADLAGVASLSGIARLAGLMKLPWYRLALLEGLVSCIGGVDAALAKAASSALLAQVEVPPPPPAAAAAAIEDGRGGQQRQQQNEEVRKDVALLLIRLWQQHAGSVRLSLPLIKTAALLITHADFAAVTVQHPAATAAADNAASAAAAAAMTSCKDAGDVSLQGTDSSSSSSSFAWLVLQQLKQELKGCGDVSKLLEGAALMAQLVCIDDCSTSAVQSVMVLMVNRYPKVRRHMAEQLYVQMLAVQAEHQDVDDESDEVHLEQAKSIFASVPADDFEAALDTLLVSAWDGPLEQVRAAREELAGYLHVEIKTRRVAKAGTGVAAGVIPKASTAEHESYQSLLDDAARGGGY